MFICPICGYPKLEEPPYDKTGCCSFEICPSCGIEFGVADPVYFDGIEKNYDIYRQDWISRGMQWWSKYDTRPDDWNPIEQLKNIGQYVNLSVEQRKDEAIKLAMQYGSTDGGHHKMWVIDQMVRILSGDDYNKIVKEFCNGEDGENTYEWDCGTPP